VRVRHEAGASGGAAWTGPVRVETDAVPVALDDWRAFGLDDYSGRGIYRRTVTAPDAGDGRVVLDLGDLAVAATVRVDGEAVASTFAPPHEVDVTDHVEGGEHELTVEVANTLANHFERETPRSLRDPSPPPERDVLAENDGALQFAGGLRGPVRLRVEPAAALSPE
jgi:hypothetical protein